MGVTRTDLSLIAAMTPDLVIGKDNALLWRLPSDLQRFKKITTEVGVVVMGRLTYDSIIARNGAGLPNRYHIVLSRRPAPATRMSITVPTVRDVLRAIVAHGERACVIGGAQIYKL